jgi:Ca2+-binding EF-hand superfamily protein
MNPRLPAFALATAAALAAGPVPAQTAAPAGPGMMMGPPREAAAVAAWADRLFARLDADADGVITGRELVVLGRGEIAARGGSRLRAMVSQSDASNDARVTPEELQAGALRWFTRLDADGDGRLSDAELPRPPAPPRAVAPAIPPAGPAPMPGMDGDED